MSCWKACVPPQYVILSVMGFLGVVVSLAARGCLSMAITEMIVPIQKTNAENQFTFCPADEPSGNTTNGARTAHEYSKRYNWTEQQQGWILSSFYAGYLLSHIPAGVLSERFGGKVTLSLTVLLTAVFNAVTPQAVEYGGYYALIVLRTFMGLVGGLVFPAVNVLLAAWIPATKRGALGSFVMAGSAMGYLISFYISGIILAYRPWPVAFYFWSIVCGIWVAFFLILCYKDPASHPFISKKELNYLKAELKELERESASTTPWKSILTSAPVMALIIVQMSHDCLAVTLTVSLPKYMKEILGFSIDRVGLFLSLSFLIMWICSILCGFLSDYLVNRNYLRIVQARKLYAVLAGIIPTGTFVVASYTGCDRISYVILLIVAMAFVGCYFPGARINSLDLSKNYAGTIMSLANGCGALTSWIFPNFIGMMIESNSHDSSILQWRNVYWTLLGTAIAGLGVYLIWASGDVQPWNYPKESKSRECDKMTDEKDTFIQ